jgi:nucleotide-binding universal stress UspA family protein
MKRIVIGTDGSADARAAVREGVEIAEALGAAVTFVYSRQTPMAILGEPYYQDALTEEQRIAERAIAEAVAVAREYGLEAETEILEGEPAEAILRVAESQDADLIVVGSRGLGPIASAFLGSVSRTVMSRAHRPVLVAKAPEAVASKT